MIRSSEIHHNGAAFDFYLDGGFSTPGLTIFEAEDNWWGTPSTSQIALRIYDRV